MTENSIFSRPKSEMPLIDDETESGEEEGECRLLRRRVDRFHQGAGSQFNRTKFRPENLPNKFAQDVKLKNIP